MQYKFDLIKNAACVSTEFLLTNHWQQHEGKRGTNDNCSRGGTNQGLVDCHDASGNDAARIVIQLHSHSHDPKIKGLNPHVAR